MTDERSTDAFQEAAKFWRSACREPICFPREGELVDRCQYSKTGWAIWRAGRCTCRPADPITPEDAP